MYAKRHLHVILALCCIATCLPIMVTGVGCTTTAKARGISVDVIDHQREIDELANRSRDYQRAMLTAASAVDRDIGQLETIKGRVETIGGTADEVISLFDEYTAAVEQLIGHYYYLRRTIESTCQSDNGAHTGASN